MDIKLLLVDDEEDFTQTLAERLQTRGFDVRTSNDGDRAIEELKTREADIVILDIMMPGKGGIEVLKEIKHINPLIEVILLTGHASIDTSIAGLKMGAYDYLMKPTETADLLTKITKAYARKVGHEERIRQAEIDKIVLSKGW